MDRLTLLWCEIGNPFFLEGITKEKFHRMFGLVPCAAGSDRALVLDCRVGLRRRYFGQGDCRAQPSQTGQQFPIAGLVGDACV